MENNDDVKKLPFVAAKIDKLMHGDSNLKAFATITISGSFMVHNIKVLDGSKGLFVSMPSHSFTNNQGETKYSDICHAINADMKHRIDAVVLKAYDMAMGQSQGATSDDIDENTEDEPDDTPFEEPDPEEPVGFGFSQSM